MSRTWNRSSLVADRTVTAMVRMQCVSANGKTGAREVLHWHTRTVFYVICSQEIWTRIRIHQHKCRYLTTSIICGREKFVQGDFLIGLVTCLVQFSPRCLSAASVSYLTWFGCT